MTGKILILVLMITNFENVSTMWRPLCKDTFNIAWWALPPYIYEKNNTVVGILPIIMKKMIHYCCNKQVSLSYDLKVANKVEAVEQVSNGTADFVLPLTVHSGKTKFLSFPHITVVESPGIAFYSRAPLSAGKTLLMILITASPILLYIAIMVMIAGTSYWLIEKRYDSSIIPGVLDGMWWAFVSMTTVGYGDISPASRKGRIAAILWILFGIVACSIFVAFVSSVLTTTCLSQVPNIRGNEIAVITGSQEHALAIKRSARPVPLSSVEDIAKSLEKGTSSGALLDSYVAGFYQDRFKNFRLNGLQDDFFNYGFVLMPSVLKYDQCFTNYLSSRQDELFSIVSKNIIPLKKTKTESRAEEMSMNIFHAGEFKLHITVPFAFVFVLLVFGLCFFKEKTECQRKEIFNGKSVNSEYNGRANDLRVMYENHQRDIIQCLIDMKRDTEILHEICSKMSMKAEREANYIANENGLTIETCL